MQRRVFLKWITFCYFQYVWNKKSAPTLTVEGLLRPIIAAIVSLILILLLCELGETVANQYALLNDELCQCDWYLFSVEMQQLLLTFMSFSQQPVTIRGYGNTQCIRETFKKVKSNCRKIYKNQLSYHFIKWFLLLDDSCKWLVFYGASSN